MVEDHQKFQDIELKKTSIDYVNATNEDNDHVINKDTECILKDKVNSKLKWRLEGISILILSVVVLSIVLTFSLIINIIFGNPQILPHGAVIVDDDLCGNVGLKVMENLNGNSVDAAVATILCLSVTRPDVSSLAACGGALVRDRTKQQSHLFDFLCPAPKTLTNANHPDSSRPATLVGVPGLVRGLYEMHKQFGTNKWSSLFTSAIELVTNGFVPSKALYDSSQLWSGASFPELEQIRRSYTNKVVYRPPSGLKTTLDYLAQMGPLYFYGSPTVPNQSPSFAHDLVTFLNKSHVDMKLSDLAQYDVNKPKSLMMGFAGYTLEAFPSPFVGGPLFLLTMGNLDLKGSLAPLNRTALEHDDLNITALLINRLIQFAKLAGDAVANLGDNRDPVVGEQAIHAQNSLFTSVNRRATVNSISDNDVGVMRNHKTNFSILVDGIGSTSVVVTDSAGLTVVINVFMGSPFGVGKYVPDTGVLLNSALNLFSSTGMNQAAPTRRPLVPVSPVYLSTTHRKCGIRAGIASFPDVRGLVDMAYVVSHGALSLGGLKCTDNSELVHAPQTTTESTNLVGSKYVHHSKTKQCFNASGASALSRVYPQWNGSAVLFVETQKPRSDMISKKLQNMGYTIKPKTTSEWTGRLFVAGFDGNDIFATGDKRSRSYAKTLYSY